MIKDIKVRNFKQLLVQNLLVLAVAATPLSFMKVHAEEATEAPTASGRGMHVSEFAERIEKNLKAKVLVDPHVAGGSMIVNMGKDSLNYGQILTQLNMNGLTAIKSKDYIEIIQNRDARQSDIPTVEKGKSYYEDEYVTDIIFLDKACPNSILATLRPMVPQYGHLSSYEEAHALVIVDTYGNVQRVKALIRAFEKNIDAGSKCGKADANMDKK